MPFNQHILPFQIAAGILIAAFVIVLIKLGMNIYRNNEGLSGATGGFMFVIGVLLAFSLILVNNR